jgi:hypothetical protein
MCIVEHGEQQEQVSTESFCGSIKSFNTRRGFGFVSCEETALRFGRDVYLSKDEAMSLAVEPAVGESWADVEVSVSNDKKAPPPVQEGDFLLFKVKLSAEGFPQAVEPQKIQRLRGVVRQAPSTDKGIIVVTGGDSDNSDADLKHLIGAEVRLGKAECGQFKLLPNDEVAFCCVNTTDTDGQSLEAQLIDLLHTSRSSGSMLGCFSLKLPQLAEDGAASMHLNGYALTDQIVMPEVPSDLIVANLMSLFGKLGGEASVTPASRTSCSSAYIYFKGPENIAKFLVHATHTISENGITQLAHVGPHPQGVSDDCCSYAGKSPRHSTASTACTEDTQQGFEVIQPPAQMILAPCVAADIQVPEANSNVVSSQTSPCPPGSVIFGTFPAQSPEPSTINFGSFLAQTIDMPVIGRTASSPDWRSPNGSIVVAPAAPELLSAGDSSSSIFIQWPTVIHASAYVVELFDQVNMVSQRFTHVSPAGALPSLMSLRVDGLQPSSYAACVRCVALCGCESACSAWSFLSGMVPFTSALPMLPPSAVASYPVTMSSSGVVAAASSVSICPPPSAPPALPSTARVPGTLLPPVPEESVDIADVRPEEILTLD